MKKKMILLGFAFLLFIVPSISAEIIKADFEQNEIGQTPKSFTLGPGLCKVHGTGQVTVEPMLAANKSKTLVLRNSNVGVSFMPDNAVKGRILIEWDVIVTQATPNDSGSIYYVAAFGEPYDKGIPTAWYIGLKPDGYHVANTSGIQQMDLGAIHHFAVDMDINLQRYTVLVDGQTITEDTLFNNAVATSLNKLEFGIYPGTSSVIGIDNINVVTVSGPIISPQESASELIKTCPKSHEIKAINKDFHIVLENLPEYSCTPSDKGNARLAVYNIFRLLKQIRFSKNLPWAPYDSAYDWLRSLKLKKIVFFPCDIPSKDKRCVSHAGKNSINITVYMLKEGGKKYRNDIYMLLLTSGVMLHEARHTRPGGGKFHTGTCKSATDETLEEMGAWAVQYHYFKLLKEDTGAYLSDSVKKQLQTSIDSIFNNRICENWKEKDHCFEYMRNDTGTVHEECYDTRERCLYFLDARKRAPAICNIITECN